MESPMLRRTFLRLAAMSPIALAGAGPLALAESSETMLSRSLRRLIYAVGPWPESDEATAEDFFSRFWHAVSVSGPYLEDQKLLQSLAEHFPKGTHAAPDIDLNTLPFEEQELLMQLVDGLYNLLEIRAYAGGEPGYGECSMDYMRYTRAPNPR